MRNILYLLCEFFPFIKSQKSSTVLFCDYYFAHFSKDMMYSTYFNVDVVLDDTLLLHPNFEVS